MLLPRTSVPALRITSFITVIGMLMVLATAIASASTTTTTISSTVAGVISLLTSSGTVNVNVTPTASGAQTISSDTVTVSTSDSSGYTLQLAENAASSAMVSGGNSIPGIAGSQASPVALTANTWGYRVDGIGGFGAGPTTTQSSIALSAAKFAPVPATASPNTIKTTASTASNDTTSVWYSVAASTAQPSGTYTNTVIYTATAN
ncbi:MAG: exported protein of unknown function [Candidatus Saccharibacteria bacterium]|nr:exported protein of unknown function [Candidatus Saccharibacteria bacterium]